jgi:hypothetical protein
MGFAGFAAIGCSMWVLAASAQASTVPVIESESVSHVTAANATLEAAIRTGNGAFSYQFEIAKTPSEFRSEIFCPEEANPDLISCIGERAEGALPLGVIGPEDEEYRAKGGNNARLNLSSAGVTLQPDATYYYRVLAARALATIPSGISWEGPVVYGPDQTFTTPPSPPVIESEPVSNITATDATIEAQINTGGRETTYRVWVGNYPECIEEMVEECDSSAKHPIEGILTGSSSPTRITINVAHAWHPLSPSSSYIYNVDATNSAWAFQGSAYGENKTFTTPAVKAPAIYSESVSHVTPTDATLEAQINTEGLSTLYQFQLTYTRCRECMSPTYNIPLPSGLLLGSFLDQSVSLDLNSAGVTLKPGFYEYSLSATSTGGTTAVHGGSFEPPEEVVQPLGNAGPSTLSGSGQSGTSSAPSGSGDSSLTPNVNAPGLQIAKTTALKSLTNAQKLAKALNACAKKPKSKRASCEKRAQTKYGTTATKAKKR